MAEASGLAVGLIVVNYGTSRATVELVERILETEPLVSHVTILDNSPSSTTASGVTFERLASLSQVSVIASAVNLGFAGGVNRAVSESPPRDAYWLLNSDAYPRENAARALLDGLAAGYAVVGSRLVNGHDLIESDGGSNLVLYGPVRHRNRGQTLSSASNGRVVQVPWVHGASMMVSHEAWRILDGFDERFFLYYEETDFCYRAKLRHLGVGLVEDSVVEHVGYASSGSRSIIPDIYIARNYFLFSSRYLALPLRLLVWPSWGCAVVALRAARRQWPRAGAFLSGASHALRRDYGPLK